MAIDYICILVGLSISPFNSSPFDIYAILATSRYEYYDEVVRGARFIPGQHQNIDNPTR